MEFNMKLELAKLVTIIVDEAIENKVIDELRIAQVKGFTCTEARGEGLNSAHISSWEGKNVRIETLVSEAKAQRIIEAMAEKFLDKYGMIVFSSDVQIFRKERFN
jgi:nitrogen regulatory protein P-II 2